MGVTSHAPKSVGKCEGMNPHTPKATPTLGDGVPVDSRNFIERFQGSKFNGLWHYLYHWKAFGTYMFKMVSHCLFGHLKHKLCPKEGSRVELLVWLPIRKSQESTRFTYLQMVCDILLESSWRGIQRCFRLHLDLRSDCKVMGLQSRRNPNLGDFKTPTWESRDKKLFGCGPRGEVQSIL